MYALWLLPTDWIDCNSLTGNIVFMLYLSGLSQPIKLDRTSARPLNGQIYVCVLFLWQNIRTFPLFDSLSIHWRNGTLLWNWRMASLPSGKWTLTAFWYFFSTSTGVLSLVGVFAISICELVFTVMSVCVCVCGEQQGTVSVYCVMALGMTTRQPCLNKTNSHSE